MNNKEQLKEYYNKSFTNITDVNDDQINRIIELRKAYKATMNLLIDSCEVSRTLSKALTDLECSLLYAVKSIVMESENY